jgi:hypothetical protein
VSFIHSFIHSCNFCRQLGHVDLSSSGEEGESLPVTALGSLADQLAVGREYPVYFEAGQVRLTSLRDFRTSFATITCEG